MDAKPRRLEMADAMPLGVYGPWYSTTPTLHRTGVKDNRTTVQFNTRSADQYPGNYTIEVLYYANGKYHVERHVMPWEGSFSVTTGDKDRASASSVKFRVSSQLRRQPINVRTSGGFSDPGRTLQSHNTMLSDFITGGESRPGKYSIDAAEGARLMSGLSSSRDRKKSGSKF